MRGVKPALISFRCRVWSRPSMLTSIAPCISGRFTSDGPSNAVNSSGSRFAACTSASRVSTQKPSSAPSSRKPGGAYCHHTGASARSRVKISCGKPAR